MNVFLLVAVAFVAIAIILAKLLKRQSEKPIDLDLNKRVAPVKRKGRTSVQIQEDSLRWIRETREHCRQSFDRDKQHAIHIGSKYYLWRTSKDGDVCPACAKNNGKRFRWDQAPPHLHPGHSEVCKEGYCRCYAQAVLPD